MKNNIIKLFSALLVLAMLLSMVSCNLSNNNQGNNGADGKDGVNGADGADGADGKDGADGVDGADGADGKDGADGVDGADGKDGKDGLTPYIGENGSWWIGDQDTMVPAYGFNGSDGDDGKDGADGITPHIGNNGNWWIGNTDTGILARGTNGQNGQNGTNGKDAFDVAVDNGYNGTYDQWVSMITGADNVMSILKYTKPNTGVDVSDAIQKAIDENPNRTIYFPDGEYLVSKPIKTSAKYDESVSLYLSGYAEIKAHNWTGGKEDAIIMLGAKKHYNNAREPGSNYFLDGGIINGNMVANGVTIDSGRETRISNTSIKKTEIGLWIKDGANSGSSDADIHNVNIIGNNSSTSVGVLIDAHDNTITNMRTGDTKIGVHMKKGGNFLRYVHALGGNMSNNYVGSIGFYNENGDNWYEICYADQFETGFKVDEAPCIFSNCFVYWWYNNKKKDGNWQSYQIKKEIGFEFTSTFNSTIQNTRVDFQNNTRNGGNVENAYMKVKTSGGNGIVFNPKIDSYNDNTTYQTYEVKLK